jgi:hypothetical protein
MGNNKREPAKRATDTEPPASFLSLWERREVRVRSIASGIEKCAANVNRLKHLPMF